MILKRSTTVLFALLSIAFMLPPVSVFAISGNQFNSGRIADDNIFFNSSTMGPQDIQNFLNSQVTSCDTNGTQIYSGSETRAQYSESKGYNPPFICLKDYTTSVPAMAADNYCGAVPASSSSTSAQIIYQVAQSCGVNPQVLIVLLQKEQALVTDAWPWPIEYQEATGYGCPDTSGCSSTYAGFFNQLYYAARQFRVYQANPGLFSFQGGLTSNVQYNPNASCGSSAVAMQTNATADLYNYTPYQPDTAALANLTGDGDSCSSYGNRNFWVYFNDWFGPTTSNTDTNVLSFIRLNDSSGSVQDIGYSSISAYSFAARTEYSSYPSVADDGSVVPLYDPNGDLAFVRLNHSSGHAELVVYSAASGFEQMTDYSLTGYPAVIADGSVIPMFNPAGDLSFIRLNYASGEVQVVNYSATSNFTKLIDNTLTGYPAVAPNSGVIPLYKPNSDLSFIRLNHSSGHVEDVTYSASSNYRQMDDYTLTGYPAVAPNSTVIPMYKPNGDLSFVRMNYPGGVQIVSYSAASDYQTLIENTVTGYPAVTDGSVIPLFTR